MAQRPSDTLLPYLQGWRAEQGMTQRQLAEKAGITSSTVYRAERGEAINITSVAKLARALGISVRDLRDTDPSARPAQ